jgi:hypothetical protein
MRTLFIEGRQTVVDGGKEPRFRSTDGKSADATTLQRIKVAVFALLAILG